MNSLLLVVSSFKTFVVGKQLLCCFRDLGVINHVSFRY